MHFNITRPVHPCQTLYSNITRPVHPCQTLYSNITRPVHPCQTLYLKIIRLACFCVLLSILLCSAGCARNRVVMDWEARKLTYQGKPIHPVDLALLSRDAAPGSLKLLIHTAEGTTSRDLKQAVDALNATDLVLLTLYFFPALDEELVALQRDAIIGEQLREQRWQTHLARATRFIQSFLADQDRLPNADEVDAWRISQPDSPRLHLIIHAAFIESRGGQPGRDFAIGVWTGAFYYYLQSWDGRHIVYQWDSRLQPQK